MYTSIHPNTPNTVSTTAINSEIWNKQVDKTSNKLHQKCRVLNSSAILGINFLKCLYSTIHRPICDVNTGQMAMTFPSSLVNTAFLALTHTIWNHYLISNEKNTTGPAVNFAFWKTDRLTDPLSN